MTTSDDSKKPEDESSEAPEPAASEPTEPASDDASKKKSSLPFSSLKADDEALPDDIDRTAEYVEEEAQRGDFVLRWGLVLLAMLFGFTQANSTTALVHAKAGQYMQANGFLPPGTDVFSASAEGTTWVQLSWLFDHVSGGLNSAIGNYSFTILSALFAAIAFGFAVHTAIPRVSTWWTVICVAIALLAAYPRFTPTPEVVTLAFLAMTMAWLFKWQTTEGAGFPWKLPVLFVVWANFDPHVWIGLLLLALYMGGHLLDRLIGRNGWMQPGRTAQLGVLLLCCVLGAMVNPFIYEPLLEPLRQYGTEYPAMRIYTNLRETNIASATESDLQWYGLIKPLVWAAGDLTTMAGTVAILLSVGMAIINIRKLDLGYLLVLLGFATLAIAATHELAAAALVAGVLAGLNGQDWFRSNFRTEYTADGKSYAFSQAGRAITVLGLAGIGLLSVAGRWTGPEGVRVGIGLDPNVEAITAGMQEATADFESPATVFNFTPEQGDLLIWAGQKPFIDSRMALYGSGKANDLVDIHTRTRVAFRRQRQGLQGTNDPELWMKTLKDHEVDYIAPRMYGRRADYATYDDLYFTNRLTLAEFSSSTALFRLRRQQENPERLKLRQLGMRDEIKEPPARLGLAQPPSFYDETLFAKKNVRSQDSLLVQHHQHHADMYYSQLYATLESQQRTRQPVRPEVLDALARDLMGASYLTIRTANRALAANENDVDAYLALASSYEHLMFVEQIIAGQFLVPRELRFRMMMAAFRQALVADPNQPGLIRAMAQNYQTQRQGDEGKMIAPQVELARDLYTRYIEVVESSGEELSETEQKELDEVYKLRNSLKDAAKKDIEYLEGVRTTLLENMPPKTEDELQHAKELVRFCEELIKRGLTVKAIDVLLAEENEDLVQRYPEIRLLYGKLLIMNGELQEATELFTSFALLEEKSPRTVRGLAWEFDAASVHMMRGEYKQAREIWSRQYKRLSRDADLRDDTRIGYLPLVSPMTTWPEQQTKALEIMMVKEPEAQALVRFYMASALIEEGSPRNGSRLISTLIREDPSARVNVLARFMYSQINDEPIELDFDFDYIPLDLNAPGKPAAGAVKQPADGGQPAAKASSESPDAE